MRKSEKNTLRCIISEQKLATMTRKFDSENNIFKSTTDSGNFRDVNHERKQEISLISEICGQKNYSLSISSLLNPVACITAVLDNPIAIRLRATS